MAGAASAAPGAQQAGGEPGAAPRAGRPLPLPPPLPAQRQPAWPVPPSPPPPSELLDLPDHLLLEVLGRVDRPGLCAVSRACARLCGLAEHPGLWPGQSDDGPVLRRVRAALAAAMHVPPQAFTASLDLGRSRRFPVAAPTFGLRPLLRVADPETLAATVSAALQDRVEATPPHAWQSRHRAAWPAVAVISVCRSDRACVRFGLRPAAAVPLVYDDVRQMGWPPPPPPPPPAAAPPAAAAAPTAPRRGSSSGGSGGEDGSDGAVSIDSDGDGGGESAEGGLEAGAEWDGVSEAQLVETQRLRLTLAEAVLRASHHPAFEAPRAHTPEEPRDRLAAARPAAAAAPAPAPAPRDAPAAGGAADAPPAGRGGAPHAEVLAAAAREASAVAARLARCAAALQPPPGGAPLAGAAERAHDAEALATRWWWLRRHVAEVAAAAGEALDAAAGAVQRGEPMGIDGQAERKGPAERGGAAVKAVGRGCDDGGAAAAADDDDAARAWGAGEAEALARRPGFDRAADAAWAVTTASDLAFSLSALHNVPATLSRACRRAAPDRAHACLRATSGAWVTRLAAADDAAAPAGAALWGGGGGGGAGAEGGAGAPAGAFEGGGGGVHGCGGPYFWLHFDGDDTAVAVEGQLIAKAIAAAARAGGGAADVSQADSALWLRPPQAALVRWLLATETLRAMTWCLWLLGAL
ncbi:hypothetical protein Rsub_04401 [Raphidocelis subcapitata]|uniref:F-box domain-containing protein n=1 Tax=Raphidocelis subcapitata TaxID=307507 RepID=A0A2V0NWN6_9CHLO|nr:hypothetical protein Rsub_04401 [Raphidocelis subcapitata]|eukprot:GBF92054.1 hypothetical protein Rsub_04401 [Raphidocelis subcapitata]